MTQHANPNIPAWVYHPSESAKIVRSESDLESHLADGWSRTPVPRSEQVPPPCPGCEQLRIEKARLQSELSALIAAQMNLPSTEAVTPGEGLPKVYVEATVESIDPKEWERLADPTTKLILHPRIPTVQLYPEAPFVSGAEAVQAAQSLGIEPNKQPSRGAEEATKKSRNRKTLPQAPPET